LEQAPTGSICAALAADKRERLMMSTNLYKEIADSIPSGPLVSIFFTLSPNRYCHSTQRCAAGTGAFLPET
jgi:hypothetical protein